MTLATLIAKKFSQCPQEVHACTCTLIIYSQFTIVHITSY